MSLIDGQKAIRNYCGDRCGCEPEECGLTIEYDGCECCAVVAFLKEQPTIEAVEVVRCKDCEYFSKPNCFSGKCTLRGDYIFLNDFCSYAVERRTNE